jgi:hypothetical protein
VILFRPYSPSRLRACSDGIVDCRICMMIVALMYGFSPSPTMDIRRMSPPEKSDNRPKKPLSVVLELSSCGLMPGISTCARAR